MDEQNDNAEELLALVTSEVSETQAELAVIKQGLYHKRGKIRWAKLARF